MSLSSATATGAWLIVFPGDVDAVVLPFLFASTFLLVGYGIGRGLARVMRVLRQPRHGTGSGA